MSLCKKKKAVLTDCRAKSQQLYENTKKNHNHSMLIECVEMWRHILLILDQTSGTGSSQRRFSKERGSNAGQRLCHGSRFTCHGDVCVI